MIGEESLSQREMMRKENDERGNKERYGMQK